MYYKSQDAADVGNDELMKVLFWRVSFSKKGN